MRGIGRGRFRSIIGNGATIRDSASWWRVGNEATIKGVRTTNHHAAKRRVVAPIEWWHRSVSVEGWNREQLARFVLVGHDFLDLRHDVGMVGGDVG